MLASFCARPVAKGIPVTRLLSCVGVSAPVLNVGRDRKSTRLNSSHLVISYAAFCLKKNRDVQPAVHHGSAIDALRLRLVPARVRVLEEQPDALAALLPRPVVAARREGQVTHASLIQRPPDRPRCLYPLGDDRLAVGSRADQSIRGRLDRKSVV